MLSLGKRDEREGLIFLIYQHNGIQPAEEISHESQANNII
jgi:hypothetical protein